MSASPSPARRPAPSHRVPDVTHHVRRQPHGSGTAAAESSATQTVTSEPPQSPGHGLVLRLRGAHEPSTTTNSSEQNSSLRRRRIHWAEDVVDNEGLGRKKSKVCCIYHKAREVGESSSEDDSSSSSSSDSDDGGSSSGDDGAARPVGGGRKGRRRGRRGHRHHHDPRKGDGDGCGHGHEHGHDGVKRRPSPNAYEKMPRYEVRPLERQPGT